MMQTDRASLVIWDVQDGMQILQCLVNILFRKIEQVRQRVGGKGEKENHNTTKNTPQHIIQILRLLLVIVMANRVLKDSNINFVELLFRSTNRAVALEDNRKSF